MGNVRVSGSFGSGISSNSWCALGNEGGKESEGFESMGNEEGSRVSVQSGISSNIWCALGNDGGKESKGLQLDGNGVMVEEMVKNDVECDVPMDDNGVENSNGESRIGCGDIDGDRKEEKSEFRYGDEERERFNRILGYYEGTHNFHNFTTRTKAEDPSVTRYILSFQANTTLTVGEIEFVKCEVVGQSFMLHQIRKMIGLAVCVMRNFASESIFEKAFDQNARINVPTAPEVGLYLDECFFTSYNKKWKDSHEELSMKDYAEEAEEFKLKYIYSHIADAEHKDGAVAVWLHSLSYRNYPDFNPANGDVDEGKRSEAGPLGSDGQIMNEDKSSEAGPLGSDALVAGEGNSLEAEPLDSDAQVTTEGKSSEVEPLDSDAQATNEQKSSEAKPLESDAQVTIEGKSAEAEPLDGDTLVTNESKSLGAESLDIDAHFTAECKSSEVEPLDSGALFATTGKSLEANALDSDTQVTTEGKSLEAETMEVDTSPVPA